MQTLHCIVSKPFFVSLSHHVTRMKGSGNCGVVSVEGVKQKSFLSTDFIRSIYRPKNGKAARFKREPFDGSVVVATCSKEGHSSIQNVSCIDFLGKIKSIKYMIRTYRCIK